MPDEPLNQPIDPAASTPLVETPVESGPVSGQGEIQGNERRKYSEEEIDQIVGFANQAYERLESLKPYESDIDRLTKDEEYRNFVRSASEHYDNGRKQIQQQQQEEIPSWARPMVEEFQQQRQSRTASQEREMRQFENEQRAVAQRIARENALNNQQIADLAFHADSLATRYGRRVGLEEAYNHVKGFSASQPSGAPPTVGLRGDASTPGIPASSVNTDDFKKDFYGSTLALLKRNGK